ncbi:HU family DNA-binding protein [Bacteroides sp.]|uniref:HU family DNA-binding protein n=1 Tax=Bacteroides sp. TaxID=29523 RepID=UPI003AB68BD0
MPVLYKTIQSTKENKDGKKLFHPRAVHIATVATMQLAKEIAEYSSLSTGDVKNTIDNMVTVMTKHLHSSESVTVDGLGTFSIIMRSRGKGAATKDEVNAAQALLLVRFTPSFTKNQDHTVATRALITGVKCVPYKKDAVTPGGGSDGGGSGSDGDLDENPMG